MTDEKQRRLNTDQLFHALERDHSKALSSQIESIEEIKQLIATGKKREAAMAIALLREMLETKSKIVGAIGQIANSNLTGVNKRKH